MDESGGRTFLDALSSDDRTRLLASARTVKARKGQMIMSRGEVSRDVFVVQDGRLEVVIYAANGKEVSLRTLEAGQLFGELSAIAEPMRSATVTAVAQTRLLVIASDEFRSLVLASPEGTEWLLQRLARQVRGLTNRVFELSALRVQARLHCELVRLYRLHGQVITSAPTHAELANRIGTHREAVTREIGELARRKIVRSERGRLEFLNPDGLEEELRTILCAPVEDESGW